METDSMTQSDIRTESDMVRHVTAVKWLGVVVSVGLIAATLGVCANLMRRECVFPVNATVRVETTPTPAPYPETPTNFSRTLCSHITSYPLSGGIYLTVCRYQEAVRVDLRRFFGEQPSIRGIHLNTNQWNRLRGYMGRVDRDIVRASNDV
ncbi:hypothetical protein BOW04_12255 [Solemya velum gill symbiont]|nr:hypothetical protein BOW04_12255 [Solemya velum gill symbiont]